MTAKRSNSFSLSSTALRTGEGLNALCGTSGSCGYYSVVIFVYASVYIAAMYANTVFVYVVGKHRNCFRRGCGAYRTGEGLDTRCSTSGSRGYLAGIEAMRADSGNFFRLGSLTVGTGISLNACCQAGIGSCYNALVICVAKSGYRLGLGCLTYAASKGLNACRLTGRSGGYNALVVCVAAERSNCFNLSSLANATGIGLSTLFGTGGSLGYHTLAVIVRAFKLGVTVGTNAVCITVLVCSGYGFYLNLAADTNVRHFALGLTSRLLSYNTLAKFVLKALARS